VRQPRIIGVDEAVMWMATGADKRPDDALKAGAVDAVAAPEQLREVTLATLQHAIDGGLEYAERRARKHGPLPLNDTEAMMAFFTIKSMVAQQAGKNYPAPIKVVDVIEQARSMGLDDALEVEAEGFAERWPPPWSVYSLTTSCWARKPRAGRSRRTSPSSAPRYSAPASWAVVLPTRAPSRVLPSR
jgi:enoyl-CoA hydratase/carnithine racemase